VNKCESKYKAGHKRLKLDEPEGSGLLGCLSLWMNLFFYLVVLTGESITFIIAQALAVIYCSVCGMKMNFPRAVVEERCVITRSNFAWWV